MKRSSPPQTVRCAIYTRKSTEEGLDQDFNTLDAQREACEAYIASQRSLGWICLPERYDDGGFSGGNLDRPALKRLIAQIEAGQIDCIVVYKVDRLSRSLLDFARLVEVLDAHDTSLVSVTQPINTADSAGRLMLNVLLSFAQYEREMIADRTRDKMSAARRKGKWTGGMPILGYDVHPDGGKLVVNEEEARQVREIFRLYIQHQSLAKVCEILQQRGITTKSWTTRKGRQRPGSLFTKSTLQRHLTNVTYIGQVKHRGKIYPGEQPAIIQKKTFERVQEILAHNLKIRGSRSTNRYGALLRGIARCKSCDAPYVHSTTKKGTKVYRYYVCSSAQRKGYASCPRPSIPAQRLEAIVVDQIRRIGKDPDLQRQVLEQALEQHRERTASLTAELKRHRRVQADLESEKRGLLKAYGQGKGSVRDLELVDRRLAEVAERIAELEAEAVRLKDAQPDAESLQSALKLFTPVWDALYPIEQARIIELLIKQVDFDGRTGKLGIEFQPVGVKLLAEELEQAEEAS